MNTVNKIKLMNDEILVGFNLTWPVGVTYPQYPGEKSPMDLWGEFSTWEPINYNGAFFRAAGGNANPWIEVTTTNGTNFTIKEGWTVPLNSALKYGATVMFNGESRTVNSVVGSGSNITSFDVNSAFTEPSGGYKNITNVYILQDDLIKKHTHKVEGNTKTLSQQSMQYTGKSGPYYGGTISGGPPVGSGILGISSEGNLLTGGASPVPTSQYSVTANIDHNHQIDLTSKSNDENSVETRPINIAYTIWRRTA